MTKIVINVCYGGFCLSPKAIKRIAELLNRPCYFSKWDIQSDTHKPYTLEEAEKEYWIMSAFDVPNIDDILPGRDANGLYTEQNKVYEQHKIPDFDDDRSNPILVQVVEELKDEANGRFAELKIVEIPDDVDWEISEYDGTETVEEKHRSWN